MSHTPVPDVSPGDFGKASWADSVRLADLDLTGRVEDLETAVGSGSVTGPVSSTDNAIARWDGTGGTALQNSGITIPDGASGSVNGTNTGDVTLAGTPNYITLAAQVITRALIDLASHVTGRLPFANLVASTSANRLMGRGSSGGAGDFQEIALGTNLSMSGTTLNASGGSGGALDDLTDVTVTTPVTDDVVQYDGAGWVNQPVIVPDATITNAKLADMVQSTIKGRAVSAGTGVPTDLTATQATAILNAVVGDSGSGGTKGLVPAPSAGDTAAGKFLKADGTFAVPGGTGAPVGSSYIVVALDGTLSAERRLQGTSNQIALADGGANGDLVLSTPQNIHTSATPQFAREGLGVAADSSAVLKMAGQYGSTLFDAGNSGSSKTLDWDNGNTQLCTMTAACTFTLSNPKDGFRYLILLKQDGTGGWAPTWPSSVKWAGGTVPTWATAPGRVDLVTLVWVAGIGASGNYLAAANVNYIPA